MRISIAVTLALVAAVLAGCGGGNGPGSTAGGSKTVVGTRQTSSSLVMVDSSDHTLYTFSGDSCDGKCAKAWPPLLATGSGVEAKKDSGLEQGKLGTTPRSDGSTQVTYAGHPLYLFSHDGPGDTGGDKAHAFGGDWSVARAKNPFQRQTTTGVSCEPNCGY
jgi:predicted lipoprotein with Yx(FWY)xxD motif